MQLEHSTCTVEDGCPLFVPSPGPSCLHDTANLIQKHKPGSTEATVWSLCEALWGELSSLAGLGELSVYRTQQIRRRALSQWLADVVHPKVKEEVSHLNHKVRYRLQTPSAYNIFITKIFCVSKTLWYSRLPKQNLLLPEQFLWSYSIVPLGNH